MRLRSPQVLLELRLLEPPLDDRPESLEQVALTAPVALRFLLTRDDLDDDLALFGNADDVFRDRDDAPRDTPDPVEDFLDEGGTTSPLQARARPRRRDEVAEERSRRLRRLGESPFRPESGLDDVPRSRRVELREALSLRPSQPKV